MNKKNIWSAVSVGCLELLRIHVRERLHFIHRGCLLLKLCRGKILIREKIEKIFILSLRIFLVVIQREQFYRTLFNYLNIIKPSAHLILIAQEQALIPQHKNLRPVTMNIKLSNFIFRWNALKTANSAISTFFIFAIIFRLWKAFLVFISACKQKFV